MASHGIEFSIVGLERPHLQRRASSHFTRIVTFCGKEFILLESEKRHWHCCVVVPGLTNGAIRK